MINEKIIKKKIRDIFEFLDEEVVDYNIYNATYTDEILISVIAISHEFHIAYKHLYKYSNGELSHVRCGGQL